MDNIKLILTLAWRNLWRNKTRTAIMIAATLFAVLLAVLMKSVQDGMYDRQIDNVVTFNTGYLQIQQKDYSDERTLDNSFEFLPELSQKIAKTKGVKSFTPRLESFVLAANGDVSKGVMITGTNPKLETELTGLNKKVIKGKYFEDKAEIMIGKGLAKYLKVNIGDTVVFIGSGYHGISANGKFPVVGILEFGAPQLNDNMMYMPLDIAQELFGTGNQVTSVGVNIFSRKEMKAVQKRLVAVSDTTQLRVKNWEELMPDLLNQIEGDKSSGGIILGVLYMIIGFVIYGTLLMMISERMHEFSMLIAVGMKNRLIAFTLALECVIMAFLGGILGGLASVPITSWLQNSPIKLEGAISSAYEKVGFEPVITANMDWSIIWSQTQFVVILSMILSIYPIIKILRIDPLEGMKS